MKKILLMLMIAIAAVCSPMATEAKAPKEKATVVFTVSPKMTCQNCENKIKTNLRFEKGVNSIATDVKAETVTVVYDPAKTSEDALVAAFKKIGYTASKATPQEKK